MTVCVCLYLHLRLLCLAIVLTAVLCLCGTHTYTHNPTGELTPEFKKLLGIDPKSGALLDTGVLSLLCAEYEEKTGHITVLEMFDDISKVFPALLATESMTKLLVMYAACWPQILRLFAHVLFYDSVTSQVCSSIQSLNIGNVAETDDAVCHTGAG